MKNGVFIVLAFLTLVGGGCVARPSRQAPPMPDLRVTRPASGSQTTERNIQLEGSSNMASVFVDGNEYPTQDGRFTVPLYLHDGPNRFILTSGNGAATSTQSLLYIHVTSTPSSL